MTYAHLRALRRGIWPAHAVTAIAGTVEAPDSHWHLLVLAVLWFSEPLLKWQERQAPPSAGPYE